SPTMTSGTPWTTSSTSTRSVRHTSRRSCSPTVPADRTRRRVAAQAGTRRKVTMDIAVDSLEIWELAELIRTRRVTATEVTEAQLERIDALDSRLLSYAVVTRERALADAAAADTEIARGHYRGPLHGVPIALKDLVHTEGITTAAGTTVHGHHVPQQDGTVAARLRAAGSVLLGKVRMTEGAFSAHHPDLPTPVNPWDADTWSGVSSSGSGVSVAAGLAFGALGSDTGGPIRLPS